MSGGTDIDLRCGRWQDVLADVACDVLITDPPYSARTEVGVRSGSTMQQRHQIGMGYEPITAEVCNAFVEHWHLRTRGWMVICGDHVTFGWWEWALRNIAKRYTFAPVVIVKHGAAPRMCADGPGSHCEYIAVARPKTKAFAVWGSLRGWYEMDTVRALNAHEGVRGAKSLPFMRALVRDYSRPGDIVCDPCAGGATTLLAAAIEGRRAVGSEMDPDTHRKAMARIARGYTPTFDFAEGT